MSIKQIHQSIKNKEVSAQEITEKYLAKIKEKDSQVKAYLLITEKLAKEQAQKADEMFVKGEESLLTGIPIALKDNFLLDGYPATSASKILEKFISPYNATVIKKLKKLGAVFLGKTNMDEFAMGSSTENSAYQITHNPRNLEYVPGGSSGGSAAAVAADECVVALGSDTGGSIRQPASFCGVIGLKPTYGAVSRYGLMAMASSLDQIGPLASSIEDAEIIFDAIKGKDKMDATSVSLVDQEKIRNKQKTRNQEKIKVGLPKECFSDGVDEIVRNKIQIVIDQLSQTNQFTFEEVSLPHLEYALPCYYIIMASEVSSNLARFDGIRYGQSILREDEQSSELSNMWDIFSLTRGKYFGPEVIRRIMLGTYSLSSGYYDAYYLKAQKVRRLIKNDFENVLGGVDVIFTPTSPTPAFKIGEKVDDPIKMYLSDIYTVPINLAGVPAMSMPIAQTEDNLPIGLQIIGNYFDEKTIFDVGKKIELLNLYE
ncbi:MAG TPA: Asp-tRNA(Asn)/Glu-tRNA(Gln) amidotransferase subunit GatA [Candidatus Portnoybacteria bacterium]|nr:Asp-tRNA(Asn)/Glu-tRNA(Gln) amidotransferase subunit GatA [Candidatus Portnoybacteria bacterium]